MSQNYKEEIKDVSVHSYRYVDHVSDVGFIARGSSLEDVFSVCGHAMFGVVADISTVGISKSFRIFIEADDLLSLMVDWLSELLFLFDAEEVLFSKFHVISIEFENGVWSLHARVYGDPIDKNTQNFGMEVKAVTYNNLRVEKKENFWESEVVLDL